MVLHITWPRNLSSCQRDPTRQPRSFFGVSEDTIRAILLKFGLWGHVFSTDNNDGVDILHRDLSSLPILSAGQSQLLTMARAGVKKYAISASGRFLDPYNVLPKPVLLLDEPTASLDPAPESKIHELIDTEFVEKGCTYIISHRSSVLSNDARPNRDIIAWIQDGSMVEVGNPGEIRT